MIVRPKTNKELPQKYKCNLYWQM